MVEIKLSDMIAAEQLEGTPVDPANVPGGPIIERPVAKRKRKDPPPGASERRD